MKRSTTLATIYTVELRVAQSRRNTLSELRRANAALRAILARPTTLALVAGTAGIFGFWLERRQKPTKTSPRVTDAARPLSSVGVLLAIAVRYGMQWLPFILQKLQAARKQCAEHA